MEPCFRVGDNRDEIVLGVAHALGVRLSCSSVNDVKAAVVAARCVSTGSALSPKLLDTHVCRPPALLRTSSAAGVQVYEVSVTVDGAFFVYQVLVLTAFVSVESVFFTGKTRRLLYGLS